MDVVQLFARREREVSGFQGCAAWAGVFGTRVSMLQLLPPSPPLPAQTPRLPLSAFASMSDFTVVCMFMHATMTEFFHAG